MNAARDYGGGIVYIPEGTYKTSGNLTVYSNTKVLGNNAKIAKADVTSSYAALIVGSSQSNVTIEGMWIENNKSNGCFDIELGANSSRVLIKNNKFTGRNAQAILANTTGIKHIEIAENHFEEVTYGVLTNSGATNIEDVRIVDNEFINIYGDAVELNHPGTAYTAGSNIIIANNFISVPDGFGTGNTAGFGIGIAGATHVSITGNVFKNARYEAIHIEDEAKHISIVGNIINGVEDDPATTLNSGIYVIDGDYISIVGNSIDKANDYGIHMEYATGTQATNTTVTGNTVTRSGGGIKLAGTGASDIIISDNVAAANVGHGFSISASPQNVKITNNISRKNGGYGINFGGSNPSWYISGNSFYDNTSGDINLGASVTTPIPLRNNLAVVSGSVTSNYTSFLDTFSLGKAAEGILYVTATRSGNSDYATAMYKASWNGTSLTISSLGGNASGVISLTTPVMNGNKVQVKAYCGGTDGTTVNFTVQFEGMIMLK